MSDQVAGRMTTVEAVTSGEASEMGELSLEGLYDDYGNSLYRFALALLGSADDAEDAVGEVFARVARDLKRLRRVDHVRAYLFTATRNAAYSVLRGRRRREDLHLAMCAEFTVSLEAGPAPADSVELCKAFAELPVEQREIIVLKVYDQMTFREIGEVTRTSTNTAASRYRYAIEKLRQALEVNKDG